MDGVQDLDVGIQEIDVLNNCIGRSVRRTKRWGCHPAGGRLRLVAVAPDRAGFRPSMKHDRIPILKLLDFVCEFIQWAP